MPSLTIKVECDILTNPILKIPTLTFANILAFIILRDNSVGLALSLLPNDHQFESPQGHWRFTRSLTLRSYGINRGTCKLTRTSAVIKKNKKILLLWMVEVSKTIIFDNFFHLYTTIKEEIIPIPFLCFFLYVACCHVQSSVML